MNASAMCGRDPTARSICLPTIRPDAFCVLRRRNDLLPLVKHKERAGSDQRESESLAESDRLTQIEIRECGKHREGDHFLQGLELSGAVHRIAVAIGGHR